MKNRELINEYEISNKEYFDIVYKEVYGEVGIYQKELEALLKQKYGAEWTKLNGRVVAGL